MARVCCVSLRDSRFYGEGDCMKVICMDSSSHVSIGESTDPCFTPRDMANLSEMLSEIVTLPEDEEYQLFNKCHSLPVVYMFQ